MATRKRPRTSNTYDADGIEGIRARIKHVDNLPPHVNALIFGPNGQGKTTFASTAPRCLIIGIQEPGGTTSAAGTGSDAEYVEVKGWTDLADTYWMLKKDSDAGKSPYKSVAIDTVSAAHAAAMDFVLKEAEDRDPTKLKSDPDQRSFGRANKLLNGLMLSFCELPMHTVLLSQRRENKDEDTKEIVETTLALPPGSQGPVLGLASIKGYMYRGEVKVKTSDGVKKKMGTTTLLEPTEDMPFLTDRTRRLGAESINLTMPKVIAAYEARRAEIGATETKTTTSSTRRRRRPAR